MEVVNTMYKVLTSDPANYFILDSLHSLPHLIEVLPVKSASVQVQSVCERVGWGVVRWCCGSGVRCSEVVGEGWGVVRWCCGSGVGCSEVVL